MRALSVRARRRGARCSAPTADPGLGADLQVTGGTFARGALPAPSGGPAVQSLEFSDARVMRRRGRPAAPRRARSNGDVGAAGARRRSRLLDRRRRRAVGRQSDAPALRRARRLLARHRHRHAARFWPRRSTPPATSGRRCMQAVDVDGMVVPDGPMVIHLVWSDDADLDLHVVDPDGVEIFSAPSVGVSAAAAAGAARSDRAGQRGAARRRLQLRLRSSTGATRRTWCGRWRRRAATTSCASTRRRCAACPTPTGASSSAVDGAVVRSAGGEAIDSDTRGDHDAGAGRTALEFDVP